MNNYERSWRDLKNQEEEEIPKGPFDIFPVATTVLYIAFAVIGLILLNELTNNGLWTVITSWL